MENSCSADLLLKAKNLINAKEKTMKSINTARILTIVAIFTVAIAGGRAAKAAGCSNAMLQGTYSDKDTGTIVGLGPFAGVNVDTFDGKGHLTISGISSVNGSVSAGVETGKYHVNPDCTGTYTVSAGGFTIDAYFVIDQAGNELQIIITDAGNVITCVARKQFPAGT